MGLNASKRVERALTSSPEFDAAYEAVYDRCRSDAQHAFPGTCRYQLLDAAADLHASLARWGHPPRSPLDPQATRPRQVDAAIRRVLPSVVDDLPPAEFRAFAADLFQDAVLAGAQQALLLRMPIGGMGILGIEAATRVGAEVVAGVVEVYAVGVTAAVCLNLS